jgi:hypothetical protein
MAGDWIKFETCTHDKSEVWAIAATLGIDADAVVGKLLRVWAWFDEHTSEGNADTVTSSVTKTLLDRLVGVNGFCNAMVQTTPPPCRCRSSTDTTERLQKHGV